MPMNMPTHNRTDRKYPGGGRARPARSRSLLAALGLAIFLPGCGEKPAEQPPVKEAAETADTGSVLPVAQTEQAQPSKPVSPFSMQRLHHNIKALASDEFEGRQPASVGEAKTIKHLRDEFKELGVEPGNGDSWFQSVSLVSITADDSMVMTVANGEQARELSYASDFMAWTKRVEKSSKIENSELVFVGYGIVAPEYGWNDYAGIDMAGKTAVILVNDPGYASQNPELFTGNAMTYYGRWTYKYEEAARQGAAGAIIVHEDGAAGYPWEVVSGSWSGPQFDLFTEDRNMSRVQVEGWFTQTVAESLLASAGHDYQALKTQALSKGFKPVPLGLTASVEFGNSVSKSDSQNVIARIPGSERPDETIIYTAHWDHIGKRDGEGDQIYNGAVDNATGTAALIELAAAFKNAGTPPARSVVFLAVTAEESGLLGSRYYAENPIYDLNKTVAVINMDAGNVLGRTRDVTVVGYGASELDDYLRGAAEVQERVLVAEATPEKGYYYRSGHFNFAKVGVPALYPRSGVDYLDRPEGWGLERQAEYYSNNYHKPSDEYNPEWDLSGLMEDIGLYYAVGSELANNDDFPKWSEGSEFKAARERSQIPVGLSETEAEDETAEEAEPASETEAETEAEAEAEAESDS